MTDDARHAWSRHVERATIAAPDPDLAEAIARFEAIDDLAEQMSLAREVARTRQAELTLAYRNVVTVASGFRTRVVESSEKLVRSAAVVFVVRRKWRTRRAGPQRLPSHLMTYRQHGSERELVAVPTDVQPEQRYHGATPHGASAVFVDDGAASGSGALACVVELQAGGTARRLAMSALHVMSVSVDADADGLPAGADVTQRTSVNMPDGTPPMGRSSILGGRYAIWPALSMDVQLAELTDAGTAHAMLADLALDPDEPFVASDRRLHQLIAANLAMEIIVPANHPAFIGSERPRVFADVTGIMESGFALPYTLKTGGVFTEARLHHAELIRLQPFGGAATIKGDSGCAVVCWQGDGNCTLVGMLIAGDGAVSYAIPAWRLFNTKNYFGALDAVASLRPVRA